MKGHLDIAGDLLTDLRLAVSLCTRVPVAPAIPASEGEIARAIWALPLAGLLIGLAGAVVYWLATRVHLPPQAAAVLALATTILLTGAMHEDGLADTADGFGGGKTREDKLRIMRDSRIGTFGACALVISLMLRWSAISDMPNPGSVAVALVVAHTASRAMLPAFMRLVPTARTDGLSAGAGRPPIRSAIIAAGLGAVCLAAGLGTSAMFVGLLTLAAIGAALAWLSLKQVGGQSGDVLGAVEQIAEAAVLLIASTVL
ncbi:MAG: adenosylcobinamide-GDP ribazoletransferase [Bradyrhizobium sp.]